jgi:hypothetical protein
MKPWTFLMILVSFGLGILVGSKAASSRMEARGRGELAQGLARNPVRTDSETSAEPPAERAQALGARLEELQQRQAAQQDRLTTLTRKWDQVDPDKIWGGADGESLTDVDSLSVALDLDQARYELLKQVHDELTRRVKASEAERAHVSVKRGAVSIVIPPVGNASLATELKELWKARVLPLLDARQMDLYRRLDLDNHLQLDSLGATQAILLEPRGEFVQVHARVGHMNLDENGNSSGHWASWDSPKVLPRAKAVEEHRHLLEKGGLYPLPKDLGSR